MEKLVLIYLYLIINCPCWPPTVPKWAILILSEITGPKSVPGIRYNIETFMLHNLYIYLSHSNLNLIPTSILGNCFCINDVIRITIFYESYFMAIELLIKKKTIHT